ncbi:MAG: 6,7-dimethyl-8-ribityllumazine synthase [Candidatus Omnitrophica bacterium]|nr:6,7-dimethyl-8-ribityllumazine synthase [Candidatus Omnitrophota bacterium]
MTAATAKKAGQAKKKIAIVVGRFNEPICARLLEGCLDQLTKHGYRRSDVVITWVPGAFEIPLAALKHAQKKTIAAVICLGAVIQGQTDHYRLVADGAARGIMEVGLLTQKPVIFEVLATPTVELANQRAKTRGSNKGRDAADAAVEMINIIQEI